MFSSLSERTITIGSGHNHTCDEAALLIRKYGKDAAHLPGNQRSYFFHRMQCQNHPISRQTAGLVMAYCSAPYNYRRPVRTPVGKNLRLAFAAV